MSILKHFRWIVLAAATLLVFGCSDDTDHSDDPDGSVPREAGTTPDKGKPDSKAPPKLTKLKVAAVQYTNGDYQLVTGCKDDVCGLSHYVNEAVKNGANLVVTPEYSMSQKYLSDAETAPKVGDKPATDAKWKKEKFIPHFAKLADDKDIWLVLNLIATHGGKHYNTSVAFDRDGKVVAVHFKFELFGGESALLTVGPDIKSSIFDTPAGKVGLLICADAQCIVTQLNTNSSCTAHAVKLLKALFSEKPAIIAFSHAWTIPHTSSNDWGSLRVQQLISMNNVWVVGAGNTRSKGPGGGVWKPGGTAVKTVTGSKPSVVYADIPLEK